MWSRTLQGEEQGTNPLQHTKGLQINYHHRGGDTSSIVALVSQVLAQSTEAARKGRESKAENNTALLHPPQVVNLHLNHDAQLWSFQHHRRKVIVAWEKIPRKATGIISNSKELYQEKRMNWLRTFSLEGRKKHDLTISCNPLWQPRPSPNKENQVETLKEYTRHN